MSNEPNENRTTAQVAQQMLNEISSLMDNRVYMQAIQLTHAFQTMVTMGALGITLSERDQLLGLADVRNNPWARTLIEGLNVIR